MQDSVAQVDGSSPSNGVMTPPEVGSEYPVPIAVCGMAMRLPGGIQREEQLWDLLKNKRDARDTVPIERYNADAFHGKDRHGYFLKDLDLERFDAAPFHMSKFEIERLDPQHRIMLELTRECLESAGEADWRGKSVGCYIGTWGDDWKEIQGFDKLESGMASVNGHNDFMMPNKISYEYDFRGPSFGLKTACSSSLVALYYAFRDLQAGVASSAVVGGINMLLSPYTTKSMYDAGLLSPNDSCRTFDAAADGYARAEGANMVYLKRLSDAVRDGNPIRGVIRAAASNHDGRGGVGDSMYYPSSEGQEALIRACYRSAGIEDFGQTAHFECHGTGTQAGDPVETKPIANIWKDFGGISIGSAKPNVGHSEGASGLTSLIKAVLALEHKTIPANIKFSTPSPHSESAAAKIPENAQAPSDRKPVPFDKGLRVPVDALALPGDRLERISINAFGLGGSNAHAILDSADMFNLGAPQSLPAPLETSVPRPKLLALNASHPESVKAVAQEHARFVESNPDALGDIAYTLSCRREPLDWRAFAVSDGTSAPTFSSPARAPSSTPDVVLVFTGQGAQWPAMGAKLLADFSSVAESLALMDKALSALGPELAPAWNLAEELSKPKATSQIGKAEFSQPLCTAVQLVIVDLLRSWGIQPAAVAGHSSGEMAAAYAAGAITLQQAIICSYVRGLVTKRLHRSGAMAAVGLGRDAVQPYLVDGVGIACENSPGSITLSGDEDKVDQVARVVGEDHPDIQVRRLRVDKAYHSHHMTEVGDLYEGLIAPHISSSAPSVPFYSSVTNTIIETAGALNASYWRSNMESPVLFNTAVAQLLQARKSGNAVLVEVGPHSALAGPLRQILKSVKADGSTQYIPTLQRNEDDASALLSTAGQLFLQGASIRLDAVNPRGRTLTNLPSYAWNRDGRFWNESRMAREWRLRRFPHHEILGSPVTDCSALEPLWRNMLKVEDVPWLRDHMIGKDVVLPGAAYVMMACEAVRQVSDPLPEDYSLRNVNFHATMTLSETSANEILFSLRPVRLTKSLDAAWYEFTVSSHNGVSWTRHCTGQARAGTDSSRPEPRAIVDQPKKVNTPAWYQSVRSHGMHFGPRFQGLHPQRTTAHPARKVAVAHVSNDIPGVVQEPQPPYPHAITLDYCFQMFPQSDTGGQNRQFKGLKVPTLLGEVYLRAPAPGASIALEVRAEEKGSGDMDGNCLGVTDDGQVVMCLKNARLSPVGEEEDAPIKDSFRVQWQPDIDFQHPSELITCHRAMETREGCRQLAKLALLCCAEAHNRLQGMEKTTVSHMEHFRQWASRQASRAEAEGYELVDDSATLLQLSPAERVSLVADLTAHLQGTRVAVLATAIKRVLDTIEDVYSGKREGLDVLRQDDILTQVYNLTNDWDYSRFLRLLGHRTPHLRVLEIGAGTGATTELMLKDLVSEYGDRLYSSYVFTDISAGFFGAAKERFARFQGIQFQTLDVTRDPTDQGFTPGSFDLVVAANVLHATPSLAGSLANVRKLLRPSGKLLLQELHSNMKGPNFVTGILPGWWMGVDDERADEPYVSSERWVRELSTAGFAGEEAAIVLDDQEPYQTNAVIVASPADDVAAPEAVSLLSANPNGPVATAIADSFRQRGLAVDTVGLSDEPRQDTISILDLEGEPLLENISRDAYEELKAYFLKSSGKLLWLTRPCQIGCTDPRYAPIIGMTRVLRHELPMLRLATLELDEFGSEGAMGAALSVYRGLGRDVPGDADVDADGEFAWSNGKICIPRFHWFSPAEELAAKAEVDDDAKDYTYKTLDIGKKGSLKTLKWVEKPMPSLKAGEVLVEVRAVGINFKDILGCLGVIQGDLGLESAGIIRAVAPDVSSLQVGDRVGVWGRDMYSTLATARAELCFKIPDELSFEAAATMPTALGTAVHSLLDLARLEDDQSILIHSACGATGMAAVQISQMVGAEVYATVGSEEKVQYLVESMGIPRDHIFNSRDASFLPAIQKATDGRGVDVVLNSLSGELLHASWQCVAEMGSMVELGKRDFIGQGRLAMDMFEGNRAFFGVDIAAIDVKRPALMVKILNKAVDLFRRGAVKPISPIITYDAVDVETAFREMSKGRHIGKLVLRMPDDASVLEATAAPQELTFRPDASYILAGGLGGLGRSISTWMAERGAKNLIYISRGGGKREEDVALVGELAAAGCTAQIFPGSVGNLADVQNAVANARLPVAGVLQMSMVLKDRMFENTTYEEWADVATPKIPGTWNLDRALEGHDLDFFVLFSSSTGIVGYRGQANYAAAGAFQDAFVQARHRRGLPASVLDVGPVEDVGYVVQNPKVMAKLKGNSIYFIREAQLLQGLELSVRKSAPAAGARDALATASGFVSASQFCLGLRTTQPILAPGNRVPWKRDPRCALYRNMDADAADAVGSGRGDGAGGGDDGDAKLKAFMTGVEADPGSVAEEDKTAELAQFVGTTLCGFIMKPAEDLDLAAGVGALGVDSLVAIELKNWFRQRLAVQVSVLEIMNAPSLLSLARLVAERLLIRFGGEPASGNMEESK